MSVFGPMVLPDEPERALKALLKQWLPNDYLPEVARRTGRGQPLKPVQAWGFGDLEDGLEDGNLPRVMIECGVGTMVGHGDGYGCSWETGVSVVVRSTRSMDHVRGLAQAYITAICLALVQQDAFVGTGENRQPLSVDWENQVPGIRDLSTRRFIAQAEANFTVSVPLVALTNAGPDVPSDDPAVEPGEYPTAETLAVTVDGATATVPS